MYSVSCIQYHANLRRILRLRDVQMKRELKLIHKQDKNLRLAYVVRHESAQSA